MSSKLTVNHVSSSEGQLLILSGSGAEGDHSGFSPDPSVFTDTNFFVSGSASSQGRSAVTRGTAVFGGDLVVSGGIYHLHDPKMINRTGNSATSPGYGDIIKMGSAVNLEAGILYYWSNGTWAKTDANLQSGGGMEYLLGIAMGPQSAIDGVMIKGFVTIEVFATGASERGLPVYVGGTPGAIVKTAPSSVDDYVRVVGWIVDATPGVTDEVLIYFSPSNDWIEL